MKVGLQMIQVFFFYQNNLDYVLHYHDYVDCRPIHAINK